MGDWFRSITVLAVAFAATAVATIGLATVIVPGRAADPPAAGGGSATPAASLAPIAGIGGRLAVIGDRSGTLTVTSESNDDRYSLEGGEARIVFEGRPPVVAQLSWEGLEFFPEPSDCTITPGRLDSEIGVGYVEIACENLTDIRGGGTISVSGTLGMALNMVGESDLPGMGGTVSVGDESWRFEEAMLFTFPVNLVTGGEDYNMILVDENTDTGCPDNAPPGPDCTGTSLRFRYDVQTHRLTLVEIERDGEAADLSAGACSLATEELGRLSPGAAVVELTIDCPAADVPGLGRVPIAGTVIVQQLDFIP